MPTTDTPPAPPLPRKTLDERTDVFQPHRIRRKRIIDAHPEVNALTTPDMSTAVFTILCVGFILAMAVFYRHSNWWFLFGLAYGVGAFVDHALWVLIHDLGHGQAFKNSTLNTIFLLIANIPHLFPSAVSFRYYHRLHHVHLNKDYDDPDVPGPLERKLFGTTWMGKIAYLFFFPILQSIRTTRYPKVYIDAWVLANWTVNGIVGITLWHCYGSGALFFLLISSFFAIGLHPVGARWIAEHYALKPTQETYSYYGPINRVAFNIGYHNEHHDLPWVPWSRLPTLRRMAPEFYTPLYAHPSYVGLLFQFFFNPSFTLHSRNVRVSDSDSKAGNGYIDGPHK